MSTRRKFLVNCSAAALATTLTPVAVLGGPLRLREVPLEQVSFSSFATRLNGLFQVQQSTGPVVSLQLIEVRPQPPSQTKLPAAEDAANEKFSLLFRGPLRQPLEQDSYWFECPNLGRFAMFIVPIGTTETSHYYYEAIFNRPPGGRLPKAGEGNIPVGRAVNKRQPLDQALSN